MQSAIDPFGISAVGLFFLAILRPLDTSEYTIPTTANPAKM